MDRLDLVSLTGDGPGDEDHPPFVTGETVAAGHYFLDLDLKTLQSISLILSESWILFTF